MFNFALVAGPVLAAYFILKSWPAATERRIAAMRAAYEQNRDRMSRDQLELYHETMRGLEARRGREENLGCLLALLALGMAALVAMFLFANAHAIVRAMQRQW